MPGAGSIKALLIKKYGNYDDLDSYVDLTMRYPPNLRYNNAGYSEEDEIAYEQNDNDAYANSESDGSEDNDEVEADNKNRRQRETYYSSVAGDRTAQNDIELMKSNFSRGDRNINMYSVASTHMYSVRSPIQNLILWRKAIEASAPMHSLRSPVENRLQWRKAIKASAPMRYVSSTVENLTQWRKAINASTHAHSVCSPAENLTL